MEKQDNNKLFKEIENSLASSDEKIVSATIQRIKKEGKPEMLIPLIKLFLRNDEKTIRKEILQLLGNLRQQECVPVIMDILKNTDLGDSKSAIIATCWQSRLDYSEHLNVFAQFFIDGDFQTAIESFTVIEEAVLEGHKASGNRCRSYFLNNIESITDEKKPLFEELMIVLKE